MARPPLTRIDGEPVPAHKAPPPASNPPPARRPPRPPRRIAAARLPAPQIWLGAACVAILLVMLALPTGGQETGRSPIDSAAADVQGPVIATLQLPGSDLRPVRQVCDGEGLPAELCARSAACAPPVPTTAAPAPRIIRLFLHTPPTGGCP
jgi:hypothetical protein